MATENKSENIITKTRNNKKVKFNKKNINIDLNESKNMSSSKNCI